MPFLRAADAAFIVDVIFFASCQLSPLRYADYISRLIEGR